MYILSHFPRQFSLSFSFRVGTESIQRTNIRIRYFHWKFHRQYYDRKNVQFQVHLYLKQFGMFNVQNTNLMLFLPFSFSTFSLNAAIFSLILLCTCFDWDGPYSFQWNAGWVIITLSTCSVSEENNPTERVNLLKNRP